MSEKLLKTSEVKELTGLCSMTLYRLDKKGVLCPVQRTSRSKRYRLSDVQKFINSNKENPRKILAYARVSSNKQKSELENQVKYLETYAVNKGIIVDEYIKDIGSGINYKNKGLQKIIQAIVNNEVDEIIISHKDRLMRFGFDLFEYIASLFHTKVTIINLETTSPQEEIVEDLLTIITVFSNRVYGLRSYKSKIKEICEEKNEDLQSKT